MKRSLKAFLITASCIAAAVLVVTLVIIVRSFQAAPAVDGSSGSAVIDDAGKNSTSAETASAAIEMPVSDDVVTTAYKPEHTSAETYTETTAVPETDITTEGTAESTIESTVENTVGSTPENAAESTVGNTAENAVQPVGTWEETDKLKERVRKANVNTRKFKNKIEELLREVGCVDEYFYWNYYDFVNDFGDFDGIPIIYISVSDGVWTVTNRYCYRSGDIYYTRSFPWRGVGSGSADSPSDSFDCMESYLAVSLAKAFPGIKDAFALVCIYFEECPLVWLTTEETYKYETDPISNDDYDYLDMVEMPRFSRYLEPYNEYGLSPDYEWTHKWGSGIQGVTKDGCVIGTYPICYDYDYTEDDPAYYDPFYSIEQVDAFSRLDKDQADKLKHIMDIAPMYGRYLERSLSSPFTTRENYSLSISNETVYYDVICIRNRYDDFCEIYEQDGEECRYLIHNDMYCFIDMQNKKVLYSTADDSTKQKLKTNVMSAFNRLSIDSTCKTGTEKYNGIKYAFEKFDDIDITVYGDIDTGEIRYIVSSSSVIRVENVDMYDYPDAFDFPFGFTIENTTAYNVERATLDFLSTDSVKFF